MKLFPRACGPLLVCLGASRLQEPAPPEPAAPLAWLTGLWVGQGFGGLAEEQWLPARGGAMLGTFRLIQDEHVVFYELMTIEANAEGGRMRLRHFDPDLVGWEEKRAPLDWPLEPGGERRVRFGPVEYELTDEDELTVRVEIEKQGEATTETLVFRREE